MQIQLSMQIHIFVDAIETVEFRYTIVLRTRHNWWYKEYYIKFRICLRTFAYYIHFVHSSALKFLTKE